MDRHESASERGFVRFVCREDCAADHLDQVPRASVLHDLGESGVLVFRGFGGDVHGFKRFSDRIGGDFLSYQGGTYVREIRDGDATLLSVTGGTTMRGAIPLHGEMHYKGEHPRLLWFYCKAPPVARGETTLCSGAAFWAQLSPRTRERFLARGIQYVRTYEEDAWKRIFEVDAVASATDFFRKNRIEWTITQGGRLETVYRCSAVVQEEGLRHFVNNILPVYFQERLGMRGSVVRWDDGARLDEDLIAELMAVAERLLVSVQWRVSDIVLIDNQKVMHGRTEIVDDQRDILVRMSS